MTLSINIKDTEEKFNKYPSDSKRQMIENTVEGISIDHSDGDLAGEGRTPASYDVDLTDTGGEPY